MSPFWGLNPHIHNSLNRPPNKKPGQKNICLGSGGAMWDAGTWLFKLLGKPFLVNIWMETPITTVVPAKRPARQEEPKPGVPAKPAAITC